MIKAIMKVSQILMKSWH